MLWMLLHRRTLRAELPRADWRRWHDARSLAEIGELTASWLEGTLTNHPGYGEPGTATGPDPETTETTETTELVPALAAANRAGFLTYSSQPGRPPQRGFNGTMWEQRAAVEGLCDTPTLDHLRKAATAAGLTVIVHRGAHRRRDDSLAMTVTLWNGGDAAGFGVRLDRSDLQLQFGACRPSVRRRLCRAWQVTVIDPCWGRNSVLWPLLDRLAASPHPHQHPEQSADPALR